jgi:hypothetical protein
VKLMTRQVLWMLAGWAVVRKAGSSQEVEPFTKPIEEAVAPLEDEAPAIEMLESRTGKAASQWVWAAMMSRSELPKHEQRDSAGYA